MKGLIGKKTQTIDAKQMTIVPGFIDCHNHAPGNELLYEVLVGNPYDVEFVTIQSIVDKLRAKARTVPADTWVEGYFFDDTKLKDKRALNVHDLDQVSRELPVAVHHRGGHTSFYNSKALRMAGITKDTPGMAGGTYDKDAGGELNGRVTDLAGSDFDPGPFSPLMGIQGMVTRTGWNGEVWGANQRITVAEALQVNTINGAYATREEALKGSITTDKLADFVILANDLHTIDPEKIKDIRVVRTVVGGVTTYQA